MTLTPSIHNIAVAGHGTCGKTTLIEELLFRAKAIPRAGKVDDGSSILDFEPDERQRRFTIDAKLARLEKDGQKLHLIDTPGYPDFLGAVIDSFAAVESVLIAVDSVQGIRVNTRRVWKEAEKAGLARMIIITRLDAEQAQFDELVDQIRETWGKPCVPFFIPDTAGPGISKIENTLRIDENSTDRARKNYAQLVEAVVEVDENLLMRYLAEEKISSEEIDNMCTTAISKGAVVPIFCVSVAKDVGVRKTLDMLSTLAPPHDAPIVRAVRNRKGEPAEGSLTGGPQAPFLARVFKVLVDPFVGKLSFIRIFSGTAHHNMNCMNLTRDVKERLTTLLRMQGKEQQLVESAGPGDIIAVPKVDSLHIGDVIGDAAVTLLPAPVVHPIPMVKLAIEPKNRNDETRLTECLRKLAEGDATFVVDRVRATHELVIAGRSTLHLDVLLGRLKARYNLEVTTRPPKTSYLESVTRSAEGHYKHKKQTGGRGQYGEVYLKVEPQPAGNGAKEPLEFVDAVVGGAIPNQYIPAVEKGVREIMEHGLLANCPIMNCRVTIHDGTFHAVDSSEAAFKTAGKEAFKLAFMEARPCLLEPIVNIEIHIPAQFMGDITGDLNSRRGRISGIDSAGNVQIIRAHVPEAEIKTYSTELRSRTGGEGSYTVEFSHYEVVPPSVQQQVVEQIRRDHAAHEQKEK